VITGHTGPRQYVVRRKAGLDGDVEVGSANFSDGWAIHCGQHVAGHGQDRGHEDISDPEIDGGPHRNIVVADRAHLIDQPGILPVLVVRRALAEIGHVLQIAADDGLELAGFDHRIAVVPARRVVQAGLPAMMDLDHPVAVRISCGRQPGMPVEPLVERLIQELLGHQPVGAPEPTALRHHLGQGNRVHRWLADPAGGDAGRCTGRSVGAPPVGAGKVTAVIAEDDVRDHPGAPLGSQQRPQLGDGSFHRQSGQADRDEGRVPAPEMRIQTRRCHGHVTAVVGAQHVFGPFGQRAGVGPRLMRHDTTPSPVVLSPPP
jgi:hypothetical protein